MKQCLQQADGAGFHVHGPVQVENDSIFTGFFQHLPGGFTSGQIRSRHLFGDRDIFGHNHLLEKFSL
jgi:hypothetical protein